MSDKILTNEEVARLLLKLQMKYAAEIERVNRQIKHDIVSFGRLTSQTKKDQDALNDKLLKEKDNEDNLRE